MRHFPSYLWLKTSGKTCSAVVHDLNILAQADNPIYTTDDNIMVTGVLYAAFIC